jgi:hypothetical protein
MHIIECSLENPNLREKLMLTDMRDAGEMEMQGRGLSYFFLVG